MGKQTRLGDMSTEDMGKALCRLTPPLCRMAKDPRVEEALKQCSCTVRKQATENKR